MTGGNPFQVIELIRAFLDERLITTDDGHFVLNLSRLDQDAPWPKNVRALVRRRFERLTPQARALGHLLATVTPREPESAARRLAGLGRRAYGMAVAELVEHGIVAWDGNTLVFTHAELQEAAAAWVEDVDAPWWRRWSYRRMAGVSAAAAVAIFAVVRATGISMAKPMSPPYGGGEIVVGSGDSILVIRAVRDGDQVEWEVSRPTFPVPDLDRLRVFRTAAGKTIWFRETYSPDRGPDIDRVDPLNGAETPVISGPGDDDIWGISPDGEWIVFGSDNPKTEYDLGMHIARVDGSETRILKWGYTGFGWSPDGRYLGALAAGPVDTVYVFTPAGQVLASRTGWRIKGITFCGAGDRIVLAEWTDDGPRLLWWNWQTEEERVLATDVQRIVGCSPDGSAAYVGLLRDRVEHTGILDLQTGAFQDVGIALLRLGKIIPTWLSDRRPPAPSILTLVPDSIIVDWGGAEAVSGNLTLSDGSADSVRVAWSSADSSVATVSSSGILRGNQPGSTFVRGCVDDWICDRARVIVRGEPTADQLLEDQFAGPLDKTKWITFGQPVPRAIKTAEGEPALALNGDGVWIDGILSRDRFTLTQGATLELEFRYQTGLHRRDRQTANFCLVRYELPANPPETLDQFDDQQKLESVCFSYPAGELRHFDPQVAHLSRWPSPTGDFVSLQAFPPIDWTHLALQVRPDGSASLVVNHRLVKELRVRLTGAAFDDWRVLLAGHSLDTRLQVRYVTLWRGPRY